MPPEEHIKIRSGKFLGECFKIYRYRPSMLKVESKMGKFMV